MSQALTVDNPTQSGNENPQETSPWEKFDPLLHAGLAREQALTGSGRPSRKKKKNPKEIEVLTLAFVKKYIQYAKARQAPALTKGAADWIVNVYSSLRNDNLEDNRRRVCVSLCHVHSLKDPKDSADDCAYAGNYDSFIDSTC